MTKEENKCSVMGKDSECPNPPIVKLTTEDGSVYFCSSCLENVKDGAYGNKLKEAAIKNRTDELKAEIAYWRNEIYLANVKLDELCEELTGLMAEQWAKDESVEVGSIQGKQ